MPHQSKPERAPHHLVTRCKFIYWATLHFNDFKLQKELKHIIKNQCDYETEIVLAMSNKMQSSSTIHFPPFLKVVKLEKPPNNTK